MRCLLLARNITESVLHYALFLELHNNRLIPIHFFASNKLDCWQKSGEFFIAAFN